MRRLWILAAALVALVQAQPLQAETQTWFGFQVGISGGSPSPPPYMFQHEPRVVFVNDVYVVDDDRCSDDVFRHRSMWYRLHAGHWYRARTWRGPWVTVDVRRVPERVLVLPARHWKQHPRYSNRSGIVVRGDDRGRGHKKHRGRGHGHAHHDHD